MPGKRVCLSKHCLTLKCEVLGVELHFIVISQMYYFHTVVSSHLGKDPLVLPEPKGVEKKVFSENMLQCT